MTALEWPDCRNVRDLGGLPTANAHVRAGAIIRADNLTRLTAVGRHALVEHGVRYVIDLRDPREIERFPYPFSAADLPSVLIVNVPLISESNWEAMKDPELRREAYVLIPKLSPSNLVTALRTIADAPPGAVVVHCNEGRERTGVLVATLLALLGVDDETIGIDWIASDSSTMETSWILDVLGYMRASGKSVETFLQAAGLPATTAAVLQSRLIGA